ncbi:RluA family pseudouridine synthase [Photobacterium iliopiscarium]|uniref:RluA family pseudouridine synthase n=1 Tax=Photobacterium iliopiscarium TaxID=56192 RepID=UPI001E2B614F|nr:RluA family pseudouridine synthase [Photobacterium iliopiscarium]MCD9465629.1 RNA pseudouridine synthase [Photobacterium iliopiscarium]MCD9485572.1 RNA pseudouridine synthase [Photobacterium iliopiscarium]MCF2242269.1 RNA pseudouridine synthase [Photobacterium iliopiscarium]
MHASDHHFTRFIAAIDTLPLPERFTFPFCYTPHPLCVLAAQELQQHIATQDQWQHNFGLDNNDAIGHMFGVLLVQNQQGEMGYLSAFSDKIANLAHLPHFVPPVFDERNIDPAIKAQQVLIDEVTTKITAIESKPSYIQLQHQYQVAQDHAEFASESFRLQMIEQRKQRKLQRKAAEQSHDSEFMTQEFHRLACESAFDKHQQKAIRQQWTQTLSEISDKLQSDTAALTRLKAEYETLTALLQQHRYAQYQFLNQNGETKDLNALFNDQTPPQGAGDCATVKLLQYAFKQHLTPLAMAKFWWGASPAAQIRKHKYFYEACKNKCEPILQHMLTGLDIDANPLLQNPAEGKELEIVYQDDAMVVINKPAEFLSVPGKTITDSVYSRMQAMFPNSNSPLIVHRLDMATSGLIVIALTKDAHKALQQQFINRTAEKRYVALLDGIAEQDHGEINLPMRVDLDDRPRQLVCYEHGKPALTKWQVLERKDGKTTVYYYPKTGRTHQLRIHSAHQNGMNMPIVGDDLYGQKSNRLHLHAQYLGLNHPVTGEPMVFEVDADF